MDWQPIESFEEGGTILLFGKKYGLDDSEDEIESSEPEVCLMAYSYERDGKRVFATKEIYWTDEIYYIRPSLWLAVPDASQQILTASPLPR